MLWKKEMAFLIEQLESKIEERQDTHNSIRSSDPDYEDPEEWKLQELQAQIQRLKTQVNDFPSDTYYC